jgi:hypothetical protein
MTKTFNIVSTKTGENPDGGKVIKVHVEVLDENDAVVLSGETSVVSYAATEEDAILEASTYGRDVFLPDLKRNMPNALGDMPLPTDPAPEPPPQDPPVDPGV